ncbi:MAG: hypothetical protein RLZZ21_2191 [Planctomycetota bacterium]
MAQALHLQGLLASGEPDPESPRRPDSDREIIATIVDRIDRAVTVSPAAGVTPGTLIRCRSREERVPRIMNKAFCKEPDTSLPPQCPRCGNVGVQVGADTLAAHVKAEATETLGEPAYCCGTDTCDVAYFDLLERVVPVADACGLAWPKDPAGPLCGCHGLTVDDVDADLAEGAPTRVKAVVQRAGQSGAECAIKSPDGRPCVARVQRYYMRRRAESGRG